MVFLHMGVDGGAKEFKLVGALVRSANRDTCVHGTSLDCSTHAAVLPSSCIHGPNDNRSAAR